MQTRIIIAILMLLVASATLKSQDIYPSGGSDGCEWTIGSTQFITWPTYFMDTTQNLDILLWNADSISWTLIASNVPVDSGYYMWSIPSGQPIGNKYKIKLVYSGGYQPEFKFVSSDFFAIRDVDYSAPSKLFNIFVINKSTNLNIFPNPSSEIINIESNNKFFEVELFDNEGKILHSSTFEYQNKCLLDVSKLNLATGVYNLKVKFLGSFRIEKIIITR